MKIVHILIETNLALTYYLDFSVYFTVYAKFSLPEERKL